MATWIGSLRAADAADRWARCREQGLWGSSAPTAAAVQAGDELFVWWSTRGWVAHCRYLDEPAPGGTCPAPWREFSFVAPMQVLEELDPPRRSPGNPEPVSGLPTIRLGQFPRLEDEARADRLRSLFQR